jgi:hypothetical protein
MSQCPPLPASGSQMSDLRIDIASPPDREKLVAQIVIGNEQCAEINQENDGLSIEIYPRQDGQPWVLDYGAFLTTLESAKQRLINRT